MANRAKVVELAEGDRERPGRLSTCATASAREHAGPEALLHEASGWTDAAVADKMDAGVDTVRRCVARHGSGGPGAALADAPGRGRRRETSESDRLWTVS